MIIYRLLEEVYITKTLSEGIVSIEYLDLKTKQNYDDFINYNNPAITYRSDDFLVVLDDVSDEILHRERYVDLHKACQFGWYYEKNHKVEMQLYSASNSTRLNNLKELNPSLKIDNFDKFRNHNKLIKTTNVLVGAFGLCYYVFKSEYDNFFRKIDVHKDKWVINKDSLERSDYPILIQLFLYYNAETKDLNNSLFSNNSNLKGIKILGYYLESSLSYFVQSNYSMAGFLNHLQSEFSKCSELKLFQEDLKALNDIYVKKGIVYDTTNPITIATKEFLEIAKTEFEYLKEILNDSNKSKTSVFLLGMLNLGDRLGEQFKFDNFVPSIVSLTLKHIVKIEVAEKEIVIYFNENEIIKNRNKKFDYISNYINELKKINELNEELNSLGFEEKELQKNILETKDKNKALSNSVKKFSKEFNSLSSEEKELQKNILETKDKNKALSNSVKNFSKELKSGTNKMNKMKNQLKDVRQMEEDLENDIGGIESKNELLIDKLKKLKSENKKYIDEIEQEEQKAQVNRKDQKVQKEETMEKQIDKDDGHIEK